jgi:hypothetical protein
MKHSSNCIGGGNFVSQLGRRAGRLGKAPDRSRFSGSGNKTRSVQWAGIARYREVLEMNIDSTIQIDRFAPLDSRGVSPPTGSQE